MIFDNKPVEMIDVLIENNDFKPQKIREIKLEKILNE